MTLRKVLWSILVFLIIMIVVSGIMLVVKRCSRGSSSLSTDDERQRLENMIFGTSTSLYGISLLDYSCEEDQIRQGETFSKLVNDRYGVDMQTVNAMIDICAKKKVNLRDLRAGNNFVAFFANKGDSTNLSYLVYNKNRKEYITFCFEEPLSVVNTVKDIQVEECYVEGVIETTLSDALEEEGLVYAMADIFQYTVNFHMLQKGDSFKVLYQQMYIDTVKAGVGKVFSIKFTHNKKEYTAVRFKQGDDYFWNEKGENMRKSFLRSPLEFKARRTSRFGMRRHPIYHTRKMHNGVDYAAPVGTRVLSIADGRVTRAYWDNKGGGRTVWVKHSNGLESAYLHLSKFAVQSGQRVARGQVIGYVGNSGASTGPHLDFRVKQNGRYINPENLPMIPTTPIQKKNKADFEKMRDDILSVMAEYESSYNK